MLMACTIIMTIIGSGFVIHMTSSIMLTIILMFVLCLWLAPSFKTIIWAILVVLVFCDIVYENNI